MGRPYFSVPGMDLSMHEESLSDVVVRARERGEKGYVASFFFIFAQNFASCFNVACVPDGLEM